jgi:hypothetical protein
MTATEATTVCRFPTGADKVCGRVVAQRGGPGRPRIYCDDPKHNAVNRLRADKRIRTRTTAEHDAHAPRRPVSEGIAALADAITRLEELRSEFVAQLADAEHLLADLTDPAAVALEIEEVHRSARMRVDQAEAAHAEAEKEADRARRERDEAMDLQQLALEAAEEAIAARDGAVEAVARMREDCDKQLAQFGAVVDAEITAIQEERDRLRSCAVEAETDRVQARADRDAALVEIERWRTETTALRQELDACTTRHGEELAAVRATAYREERRTVDRYTREMVAVSADCRRVVGALVGANSRLGDSGGAGTAHAHVRRRRRQRLPGKAVRSPAA